MHKKRGIIGVVAGIISSTLGIIGATCSVCAPACMSSCCLSSLIALLGIGIAGFLHKYSVAFIVVGSLLFVLGVYQIIQRKRLNSGCCGQNDN